MEAIAAKNISIIRFILGDPIYTSTEKEFLSNYYSNLNFHLCFCPTRQLTKEERKQVIKEAHASNLCERNTIEKARKIGIWLCMDEDIKKYVDSCPIRQLLKTTRIKN